MKDSVKRQFLIPKIFVKLYLHLHYSANLLSFSRFFVQFQKSLELQVTRILAKSTPHPFLIFGPPGTGKTTTVCEAILQVWKAFRSNVHNPLLIIVAAHSNTAIDLVVKS